MAWKDLTGKKIVCVLGGLFILSIILTVASVMWTQRPEFCLTCHLMRPYYASWKKSVHNEVNCIECHYEPGLKAHVIGKMEAMVKVGKYLTKKYQKPDAKVSDVSCLRQGCHKKEKLRSQKVMFKNNIGFEHDKHFGELRADIQLRCTGCHSQSTFDEHISVDKNACFTCHFKNVSAEQLAMQCLRCHSGIERVGEHKQYIKDGLTCMECHSGVKTGDGQVRREMCYFCHADKEKIERIKEGQLLHKTHVYENKVKCSSCHDFIGHGG